MTVFELRGFIFHDIHQKDEEGVRAIDFFSLYVLFSQHRSCDNTLENCFFLIKSYSRRNYAQSYEETKGQVPLGPLFGKQNIQAKEVFLPHLSPPLAPPPPLPLQFTFFFKLILLSDLFPH